MNERPSDATTAADRPHVERGEVMRERVEQGDEAFLPDDRMNALRGRWNNVQAEFVDDPRRAVQDAQALVRDVITELTETFRDEPTDTESMRVTVQRYHSFFNRLLSDGSSMS